MTFSIGENNRAVDFIRALMAGISTHVFASHSFEYLLRLIEGTSGAPPEPHVIVMAVSLAIALISVWWKNSDEVRGPWPWMALGGYFLLQWIAAAVHHMVPETAAPHFDPLMTLIAMAFAAVLWFAYVAALENSHPKVKGSEEVISPADPATMVPEGNVSAMPVLQPDLTASSPLLEKRLVPIDTFEGSDALILFQSVLWSVSPIVLPSGTPPRPWPENVYQNPESLVAHVPEGSGFHNLQSLDPLKHCNWYMPLKAIYAHLTHRHALGRSRNLDVIVIPSADEFNETGQVRPRGEGSYRQFEAFKELVARLAAPGGFLIQVFVLDGHESGVSYESIEDLGEALRLAKAHIRNKDPRSLVVVDVTSGKSTCSAVGAALTLEHRERVQYVSTSTFKVTLYDIQYFGKHLPLHT